MRAIAVVPLVVPAVATLLLVASAPPNKPERPSTEVANELPAATSYPPSQSPAPQANNEQKLWSPYWSIKPGFTSTLEMKNNRAQENLRVVVAIYFASGEERYLNPISLKPRESKVIDLNEAITSLGGSLSARGNREGTLEVKFDAPTNAGLMGSVSVTNPDRGIAWNFRLYSVKPTLPVAPIRGLFWFRDKNTDGFVAVQNTSDQFISVVARFQVDGTDHSLPVFRLGPARGVKLDLREELRKLGLPDASAGGIEFRYEGPPDALKAHGVLFNNRGFSAEIDFTRSLYSHDSQQFVLRTPRFAIGPADPRLGLAPRTVFEPILVLHNFAKYDKALPAFVGIRRASSTQEITLSLAVPAGQTRIFRLEELLRGAIPEQTYWASLEITYQARESNLAGALVSVTPDGAHTIRSVLNWIDGNASEGWLWRVDTEHNTFLALMNTDTENAEVKVALDYSVDGAIRNYELPKRTIPARSTELIDVGEIVRSGVPDAHGDVIPSDVSIGGYRVSKVGRRLDKSLITEALLFNRRRKNFMPSTTPVAGLGTYRFFLFPCSDPSDSRTRSTSRAKTRAPAHQSC